MKTYLSTYAYGTVDPLAENIVESSVHPSILMEEGLSYDAFLAKVAEVCRRKLQEKAIRQGGYSPAYDKYRVSIWIPGATKREAFAGYVSAFWFNDGTVGDTVTGKKHPATLVQTN